MEQLRKRASDLPFAEVGAVVELKGRNCDHRNYQGNDELRWLVIQAGQYVEHGGVHYQVKPKHLVAFSTYPGEGCEEANFGLALYPPAVFPRDAITGRGHKVDTGLKGWCWSSFCKTEYASGAQYGGVENFLRCHLAVIRMLDHAKELGILGSVSDEGDFWEKRDVAALAREVGDWNEQIAGLVGKMKDLLGGDITAPITNFPDFEHLEARGRNPKEN
jgi:hypothetical protein